MGAVVPLRAQFRDGAGLVYVRCPGKIRVRAQDCVCGDYCPRCHKICRWPRDAVMADSRTSETGGSR